MNAEAVMPPQLCEKQIVRVLRFLKSAPAQVEIRANTDQLLLTKPDMGTIAVPRAICRKMISDGLMRTEGRSVAIEPSGVSHLVRGGNRQPMFERQHGDIDVETIATAGGMEQVLVNHAESPLSRLARLKTATGEKFLESREFRAGDRLRADFSRGQMEPRLGINWDMTAGTGAAHGAGGTAELSEAALGARRRVALALDAVGPELAGILVDTCCFLKGFAQVEQERGWPVRSAKIVLKTALAALSRHYDPPARKPRSGISHWGAQGYRPSLGE